MYKSRDSILKGIQTAQPSPTASVDIPVFLPAFYNTSEKFREVLQSSGGEVYDVHTNDEIIARIGTSFTNAKRIVSFSPAFASTAERNTVGADPHLYEDVDVFIVMARLGVAESGAIWITDADVPERVLPFISTNLVSIINQSDIVATMHDAYESIGGEDYGFAVFIAGPSKTADIEQSLVLGAHGPLTMTVFILDK